MRHAGQFASVALWLRTQIAGTRVIVSKPRTTSLGLTLLAGVPASRMLLDIDDWELGFGRPAKTPPLFARVAQLASDVRSLIDPVALDSHVAQVVLDRAARHFPHRIVSNTWLEARFGGAVLPHVRDTDFLDPARVVEHSTRTELGLNGRSWVGFIGTPRPHKGLESLIGALGRISDDGAPGLLLAGVDQKDPYVVGLVADARTRLGDARLRVVGQFDFSELPRWVALPDMICLPSLDEPAAWGQIPAKLFDAMAMAKPVVATRTNDIAQVLDGCGVLVDPGDEVALATALRDLAEDAKRRRDLGDRARERAIERYSYRAGRDTLWRALIPVEPFRARR
jgi:glycosyltransferase involved in cell wall biosynthesis